MIHGIGSSFFFSCTGTQVIRGAKTNSAEFNTERESPFSNKVLFLYVTFFI